MTSLAPLIVKQNWNTASERDWAKVLARMPIFAGISPRDLRKLVRDAEFAEFGPGDTVVATAAPPDYFYVVLGGRASATSKPAAHALSTGDYFGEMSLLDGQARSATVVAATDLHVMRLSRHAFDDMLARHPSVARAMLSELGGRVRALEHQAARRAT